MTDTDPTVPILGVPDGGDDDLRGNDAPGPGVPDGGDDDDEDTTDDDDE